MNGPAEIHWCEPPIPQTSSLRERLLFQADAYCEQHGITRARLGTLVMKDNKFLNDIANDKRGFTIRTYEKFQRFFAGKSVEPAE